jgi:hypothetical protein
MNNKLKKIIFDLIDSKTKGADTYHHNGSMWLIFTDQKKWVIEFTKQGTLWYNFNFFQQFFRYLSLDVIENQHYITEWVECILQNGVGYASPTGEWEPVRVEDTIQNGVKETDFHTGNLLYDVEDTIQNGVKHTEPGGYLGSIEMKGKIVHQLESPKQNEGVEDVIQNGVKYTVCSSAPFVYGVKDTLQHGVKETFDETHHRRREVVQTIRDGIKETYDDAYHHKSRVDGVIKNGIKQTCAQIPSIQPVVERILEEGILQTKPMDEWVNTNRIVDKVILNGDKLN